MDDAPAEDVGSHTLLHVHEAAGPLEIPNLLRLGLGRIASVPGLGAAKQVTGAFGISELQHPGADTYMGHQELMGASLDEIEPSLLSDLREGVVSALETKGYVTGQVIEGLSPIMVDGRVIVADNIEARPGININVTASLDDISFEDVTRIGQVIREEVSLPRVIVVCGRGFNVDQIRASITQRASGQVGVDSPKLGVYDKDYRVRHLGVQLDFDSQLPRQAVTGGYDVALIGKAADVIHCDEAAQHNVVPTHEVLEYCETYLERLESGLIVANVQESDLAGHEEDPERYRRILETVDRFLPRLLRKLRRRDILIITGDHGNDPCIGHSLHTRERTPILVAGPQVNCVALGIRPTLGDIAATVAEFLKVQPVSCGSSFGRDVFDVP